MVSRTNKFRGSATHGAGKKAHRGAGKRGGKGNAGLHKHRFSWTVKYDPDHFGRYGFKRPQKLVARDAVIAINVRDVDKLAKDKSLKTVDLTSMGVDKLLGSGKIKEPLEIIVGSASPTALEKVKEAGGTVVLSDDSLGNEAGKE